MDTPATNNEALEGAVSLMEHLEKFNLNALGFNSKPTLLFFGYLSELVLKVSFELE